MKNKLFIFVFFFVSVLFSSCGYQRCSRDTFLSSGDVLLTIEMPQNKLVFENMSVLVYDSLWSYFDRVGYKLVGTKQASHVLKTTIKDVDSSYKFLSPDLLTYAVKMKVVLFCRLFDTSEKLIAKKEFTFSTLIPKAKEYVVNSKFSEFEYRRLLEQRVCRIDQYFRPFLQKKSD